MMHLEQFLKDITKKVLKDLQSIDCSNCKNKKLHVLTTRTDSGFGSKKAFTNVTKVA